MWESHQESFHIHRNSAQWETISSLTIIIISSIGLITMWWGKHICHFGISYERNLDRPQISRGCGIYDIKNVPRPAWDARRRDELESNGHLDSNLLLDQRPVTIHVQHTKKGLQVTNHNTTDGAAITLFTASGNFTSSCWHKIFEFFKCLHVFMFACGTQDFSIGFTTKKFFFQIVFKPFTLILGPAAS